MTGLLTGELPIGMADTASELCVAQIKNAPFVSRQYLQAQKRLFLTCLWSNGLLIVQQHAWSLSKFIRAH